MQLIKCLKSIKQYAFYASPYPVIITLEDHLTPELQAKVAKVGSQILSYFHGKICFLCIYHDDL